MIEHPKDDSAKVYQVPSGILVVGKLGAEFVCLGPVADGWSVAELRQCLVDYEERVAMAEEIVTGRASPSTWRPPIEVETAIAYCCPACGVTHRHVNKRLPFRQQCGCGCVIRVWREMGGFRAETVPA